GRILDEDLGPARPSDDVVPELHPGGPEPLNLRLDVVHDELEAVPPARHRKATVGHGPAGRAGAGAEEEPEVAAGHVRECGCCTHVELEPEVRRIERDGGVDVVDHVADVDRGHRMVTSQLDVASRL